MMDVDEAFERAVGLHREGQAAAAASLCQAILVEQPGHARALHLLGAIRFAAGETPAAIALVERALAARPDYAEAEFNLAAMLMAAERTEEAAEHYGRAAALRPGHLEAEARHAAALMNLHRYDAAEAAFRRVLALNPDHATALLDLAALLLRRGDAAALDVCRRAVALAPDFAVAHRRLGHALRQNEDTVEALAAYRRALALEPGSIDAARALIAALIDNFELDEAERLARELMARHPDGTTAHDLGRILLAEGDASGALAAQQRASELIPESVDFRRALLATLLYVHDIVPDERFARHVELGRATARAARPLPPPPNVADPERRLRVGWLSSDFRPHPVGRNLEWLFRHFDRRRFELVAYAEVAEVNPVTRWFRGQVHGWRSTVGMSDAAVADQIRADGIDVMIYVAGRFDQNRPQIAAWRPAPVQVSLYDGATSGLAEMDYLIADPVLVPRRTTERFTERVVRLPCLSIQPPIPGAPPVAPPPCQAAGRPTFGSFANPAKLSTGLFAVWAELLRRCPDARLLLRYRQAYANRNVVERIRQGLGDELMARVDVDAVNRPLADHLDLYRRVDVALDTFPFAGSTTTFEALWMGVPVVTLAGETLVARLSASMLHALKLDELIARTPDDYVEIALRLAADAARLAALRASLRERVTGSALCDGARFTRHFERLIRTLWRRWCRTR